MGLVSQIPPVSSDLSNEPLFQGNWLVTSPLRLQLTISYHNYSISFTYVHSSIYLSITNPITQFLSQTLYPIAFSALCFRDWTLDGCQSPSLPCAHVFAPLIKMLNLFPFPSTKCGLWLALANRLWQTWHHTTSEGRSQGALHILLLPSWNTETTVWTSPSSPPWG